jgi:thiol-disulfide isomerase/thioredoxin
MGSRGTGGRLAGTPASVRSPRLLHIVAAALAVVVVGALLTGHHAAASSHRAGGAEPAFSLPALDPAAPAVTAQSLRGKPTVLLFWASWCEPCQRELPAVTAAAGRLGGKVRLVGIDTNDQRGDATAFLARAHIALPSGFDDTASLATSLRLYGLPAAVYVTAGGAVAGHHLGPITAKDIDRFAGTA